MPKRTNGEGTIYQRANGLWVGDLTIRYDIVDGKKKRIKKTFTSMDRETVLKEMNDTRYKLNRNMITQNNNFTVAEWVSFYLDNYKKNIVKAKTYDNYDYIYRCHIKDNIGDIKLDKIRPDTMQQLYNQLRNNGLSSSTIHKVHVLLNQSFEQAIRNNLIYSNPCKATNLPKSSTRHVIAMSNTEQTAFELQCTNTTHHNLFVFLLNTGLRRGEAMALSWNDIDFTTKTITVNKTVSVVSNREADPADKKTMTIIDTAKTESSMRTVPINKKAERILLLQKSNPCNDFYVFSTTNGKILTARNIHRSFHALLSKADLPDTYTIHSLRHTFATRLLEKGANIKVISDILGHASIQITLDTYSHVMPNFKHEVISLLD